MSRISLRAQLIFWNVAALAILLLVLGLLVRSVVASTMMASVDRELQQRTRPFRDPGGRPLSNVDGPRFSPFDRPFDAHSPHGGDGDGPHRDGPPRPPDDALRPRLFTLTGKPIGPPREQGKIWDDKGFAAARLGSISFTNATVDDVPLRVISRPFPERPPFLGVMQAAYPLTDIQRADAGVNRALLLISPVALVFAALGGALLTGRVLRQVRLLADSASAIRASDFSERLPTTGRDEFAALAGNFNGLLARLEGAFRHQQVLMEQQKRFTGDASHELKTPLTIIKGNTSLALSGGETMGENCVTMDEISVREVDQAADTMMSLVQDLLLLARSDGGQLGKNRIEILLREVLDRAKSGHAKRPETAEITLDCDEILSVKADAEELTRVFSNLIDNAARHTPKDGKITMTAKRDGKNAVVIVEDNGVGIDSTHLPHLGERFYRIDDARARTEGGTGLGLSICRGIIDAYGGNLTFQSEKNVGTKVTVTLPAAN